MLCLSPASALDLLNASASVTASASFCCNVALGIGEVTIAFHEGRRCRLGWLGKEEDVVDDCDVYEYPPGN